MKNGLLAVFVVMFGWNFSFVNGTIVGKANDIPSTTIKNSHYDRIVITDGLNPDIEVTKGQSYTVDNLSIRSDGAEGLWAFVEDAPEDDYTNVYVQFSAIYEGFGSIDYQNLHVFPNIVDPHGKYNGEVTCYSSFDAKIITMPLVSFRYGSLTCSISEDIYISL